MIRTLSLSLLIGGLALSAWAAEPPDSAPPSPASASPLERPASRPAVVTDLQASLSHVNAYLRARTGREMSAALEVVKDDGMIGVRALIERFRQEATRPAPSRDAMNRLSHALVKIGKPSLVPVVATFRNPSEPEPLRAEMARIVGRVQGYRSVYALVEVLADALERNPSPLAARILEVLGDLADPRPFPSVERALFHEDPSVRFAAATAMGKIQDPSAFPPLLKALDDPDLAVRAAANRALVRLSGTDQGYVADGADAQRAAAVGKWRDWWMKNRDRLKPPPDPLQAELWRQAGDILAWAATGAPLTGLKKQVAFPVPRPPAAEPILVSTQNLPAGTLPVVEGRRIILRPPASLNAVPAGGYWRFGEPNIEESRAEWTLSHVSPGGTIRHATMRFALGVEGWRAEEVNLSAISTAPPSPPRTDSPAPQPAGEKPAPPLNETPPAGGSPANPPKG